MCKGQNDKNKSMTISELLSAISENEYPEYMLDAISRVQEWMNEVTENDNDGSDDIFSEIFNENFEDDPRSIDALLERLEDLEKYADVVPNSKSSEGKSDAVIVSITPPDYESGLRMAIDYAAVFNRPTCKRVWIISDTFILDDVMKFSAHVDALAEQGITLRYILVTPWGWVELPLSGKTAAKHSFLWRSEGFSDDRAVKKNNLPSE